MSEWAYQDRAKNTLFTPGACTDLVLKYAWLCCTKFKISRMTYSVLNIGTEYSRHGRWEAGGQVGVGCAWF